MGICCSKKVQDPPLPLKVQTPNAPTKNQINNAIKEEKKVEERIAEKPKRSLSEKPKKKEASADISNVFIAPLKPEETRISTPVRTSSCTKEEVDAILIQCGRLSRSSSEKRKHSGSKRSFDFDNEKGEGEEEEEEEEEPGQTVSRPSPRRRRTPSRERSGSKERVGGQSQRRVSRSPNRRNECEKTRQQPAKMVPVPACEKAVALENTVKKADASSNLSTSNGNSITTTKRNASPRSRSCERSNGRVSNENNNASLSRSNSRKGGEQSPFRRSPMTEIDENLMKAGAGGAAARKANQAQTQSNGKEKKNTTTTSSTNKAGAEQQKSSKTKEKEEEQCKDVKSISKGTRTSTRRSSRDLDSNTNGSNYASLLLEDIENYQQENTGFSLPACVSKACSIMEAVADMNSSSSDQSYGRQQESIQKKYGGSVSEELQESAGSNSYVGQPQPWHGRNSVDSTERSWVAAAAVEVEEEVVEGSTNGRIWKRGGGGGGSSGSSRVSGTSASSSNKNGGGVAGAARKDYVLPVAAASS